MYILLVLIVLLWLAGSMDISLSFWVCRSGCIVLHRVVLLMINTMHMFIVHDGGILMVTTLASSQNASSAQSVFSFALAPTDTQPVICNFIVKANFS